MLRLLALLQSRRAWSGAELAERLGVTERTLRRDIDRLRALDYPVIGTTGIDGGYRLTSGNNLPPLLLADDEAVAVAVGLGDAASGSIAGIEDSSLRALVKLEQVLPPRLRPQLSALTGTTTAVANPDTPQVDPTVLAVLTACSQEQEIITFDYHDRDDQPSSRRVEPHSLVTVHRLWYLLAYDPDRDDWRTFRVDRIHRPSRTHRPNTPRELPAPDAASYLTRSFAAASYRYTAHMTVQLPSETVRDGVFGPIPGDNRRPRARPMHRPAQRPHSGACYPVRGFDRRTRRPIQPRSPRRDHRTPTRPWAATHRVSNYRQSVSVSDPLRTEVQSPSSGSLGSRRARSSLGGVLLNA